MVTVEITVPGRIPSNVAVRLGEHAFTVTLFFTTAADFFITQPCLGADGSAVASKGDLVLVDEALINGMVKELFLI